MPINNQSQDENFAEIERNLRANHSPAVMAGGMRIVQNHRGNYASSAQSNNEVSGVAMSISPQKPHENGGILSKLNQAGVSKDAIQSMYKERPFINPPVKNHNQIHQPRKE
uniref:Uncharacterized protein n=1 Tax=Cuerna arida TaxID=1464854 RepID=A0A1B6EPS6_9HEMI